MQREWAEGISVGDTIDSAIERARRFPKLGAHIVKICIPEDIEIEVQQTGANSNHFTIYGAPGLLMSFITGEPILVETAQ